MQRRYRHNRLSTDAAANSPGNAGETNGRRKLIVGRLDGECKGKLKLKEDEEMSETGSTELQVPRELSLLEKTVEETMSLLASAEAKLESVLRKEGLTKDDEKAVDQQLVPLADRIRSIRRSVERSNRTISELIDRAEL